MPYPAPTPLDERRTASPQVGQLLWPVWLSLAILAVTLAALITTLLGFDAAAWYANGWFWLGLLVASVVALVGLALRTRDRIGRRMQSAIILSLLLHVMLGVYLKDQFISFIVDENSSFEPVQVKPLPQLPQYFHPASPTQVPEQAFAKPAESAMANASSPFLQRQRDTDMSQQAVARDSQREIHLQPSPIVQERQEQAAPRRSDVPAKLSRQTAIAQGSQQKAIKAPRSRTAKRLKASQEVMKAAEQSEKRLSKISSAPSTAKRRLNRSRSPATRATSDVVLSRAAAEQPQSVSTPSLERRVEAGRLAETDAKSRERPSIVRSESKSNLNSQAAALSRSSAKLPAARSQSGPTLKVEQQESALGEPMLSRRSRVNGQPSVTASKALRSEENVAKLQQSSATMPAAPRTSKSTRSSQTKSRYATKTLDRSPVKLPAAPRSGGGKTSAQAQSTATTSSSSHGQRTRPSRTRPDVSTSGNGSHLARRETPAASLAGGSARARDANPAISSSESLDTGGANSIQLSPTGTEVSKSRSSGRIVRRGNFGRASSKSRLMQSAESDRGSGAPQRSSLAQRSLGEESPAASRRDIQRRNKVAKLSDAATIAESKSVSIPDVSARSSSTAESALRGLAGGKLNERLSDARSGVAEGKPNLKADAGVDSQQFGSPGIADRRANRRSIVVSANRARFMKRRAASPATTVATAREPTAPFARRSIRQRGKNSERTGAPAAKVESAIERGLAYLASVQLEDGRWTLQNTSPERVTEPVSQIKADTAATGLALLAFLGAGYDHFDDQYRDVVDRGLSFLKDNQQQNGDLYLIQKGPSNSGVWLYSHGIAALAMCEAYGMTGDEQLRSPAQNALNFIAAAQHPERGGWRYAPRQQSDLSVSGWQLMALRSGQLAQLKVSKDTMAKTRRLLDSTQAANSKGGEYVYNPWGDGSENHRFGNQANAVMTSVGLLMRLYSGSSRDNPDIQHGADVLLQRLANNSRPPKQVAAGNPSRDTYYWYNATQVMFHMQGEHWEKWQASLYPLLIASQEDDGPLRGSWDPYNPVPDRWGYYAGRLYFTTMNLLSLEIYHRHLPLFDTGLAVQSK